MGSGCAVPLDLLCLNLISPGPSPSLMAPKSFSLFFLNHLGKWCLNPLAIKDSKFSTSGY